MALGSLLPDRNQLQRAREVYEKGLQQFAMLPGLYDGLAAVLEALGEEKKACSTCWRRRSSCRHWPFADGCTSAGWPWPTRISRWPSKAYRHAVEQGRTSRFKSPENYLPASVRR